MKVRLIAKRNPITWLKMFTLMLHSSKTPIMSDEDKALIDDIVSDLRVMAKGGVITEEEIAELKAIAKPMQKHEALSVYDRLKYVSAEIQLTRLVYYK